ncbi:hypothetical protein SFRURICE_004152 [Spodoptera frugiperda]|nr:hypothetical protein SFRURICE_004152 [Spodoptera frugiperda]
MSTSKSQILVTNSIIYYSEVTESLVVGIGNPLLDISVMVDDEFLKKYDLKPNDAIMADSKHLPLYKEITEKFTPDYLAGGSVQNSTRVAQWILKKPNVCSYFGCVGNDDFARILKDKAESDGVNVLYQVTADKPTGTCAVLLTDGGNHRSLCANLAAAQQFTEEHIHKPECKAIIEKAKLFYSSGFFLAVSPETMMSIAKHASEKNQVFALNVSAPFVMEFYKKPLEDVLPYIALEIAKYPKVNNSRARVVVITRGSDPVILVNEGKIEEIPVMPLKQDQIVDTNGAGDAFTGGFISQIVRGRPLKECVQCAMYAASHIIQNSGCSFAGPSEFKLES